MKFNWWGADKNPSVENVFASFEFDMRSMEMNEISNSKQSQSVHTILKERQTKKNKKLHKNVHPFNEIISK